MKLQKIIFQKKILTRIMKMMNLTILNNNKPQFKKIKKSNKYKKINQYFYKMTYNWEILNSQL